MLGYYDHNYSYRTLFHRVYDYDSIGLDFSFEERSRVLQKNKKFIVVTSNSEIPMPNQVQKMTMFLFFQNLRVLARPTRVFCPDRSKISKYM